MTRQDAHVQHPPGTFPPARRHHTPCVELLRYLIAVRERPGRSVPAGWRARVRERLRLHSMTHDVLGADEALLDIGGEPMGSYRFVEREELQAMLPGAAWWRHHLACPWLGEVAGFLSWQWWHGAPSFQDRRYFTSALMRACNGFFARTDTGEVFEPIIEADHALAQVHQKHGFGDGAFFLWDASVAPDYHLDVRARITRELARHDRRGAFITYGTSHNPVRIDSFEPRRGESAHACLARFHLHSHWTVRLWGYDLEALDSPRFQAFLDDDAGA